MPADRIHPTLGSLTYDEGLNWYASEQASKGLPRLYLSLDACPDEAAFLELASRRLGDFPALIFDAKEAASALLDLANSEWREEGCSALDSSSFKAKLRAESATLFPDGSAEVFFRADNVFAGHGVIVSIDANGRATDPTICG